MRPIRITKPATLLVGLFSMLTGSAVAQQEAVIEVRSAGLMSFEPVAKDAAAMTAFKRLGNRLGDLGEELGLEPMQQSGINLLWDLLTSGLAMRIDLGENGPGLAMAISPTGGGGAAELTESIGRFLTDAGQPLEIDDAGAMVFGTPIGMASISTAEANGEQFTLITVGAAGEIAPGVFRYELPAGATPMASGRIDLERLGAFVLPMMAESDEQAAEQFASTGWFGEGAPTIEFAVGNSDSVTHTIARVINGRAAIEAVGGSSATFTLEDFRVVPEDASLVSASTRSLLGVVDLIDKAAAEQGQDVFGQASELLGVDVRTDVLLNLGPKFLYYQADSTGGGGLMSSVMLAEIKDADSFAEAHGKIVSHLNEAAAAEAQGYVRVRNWQIGEARAMSLTFPGLPIPLELSWSIHEGYVVVAASPAGLIAAMGQMSGDGSSILDRRDFADSVAASWPEGGATLASFVDAERLAKKGYGLTNLATSALANAVRSPANPDRVSEVLMPSYAEFTAGISPTVSLGWWDGDDLVFTSTADQSLLVQFATGAGLISGSQGVAVTAVAAGILLPALGKFDKAQNTGRAIKSSTQVRGVVQGLILYGQANSDTLPDSIDDLNEDGYTYPELFDSPFGPAPDGGPSIAMRVNISPEHALSYEANVIIAIDRSSLFFDDTQIVIGFADSHVNMFTREELEAYLEMPVNEGAREELQIP